MPTYDYECKTCGIIEIIHLMSQQRSVCPHCKKKGLVKQIAGGGAVIIKGKMMNQYNDVKHAKYWRDHNGVRHRVTPGDGHSKAPTVSSKQTRSTEEVKFMKKIRDARRKKERSQQSYNRFQQRIRQHNRHKK